MERVNNASSHMQVTPVVRGKSLDQSKLDTMDGFIVDGGAYVWREKI